MAENVCPTGTPLAECHEPEARVVAKRQDDQPLDVVPIDGTETGSYVAVCRFCGALYYEGGVKR